MLLIYLSMLENEDEQITFEYIYRKYYDGIYRRIYKIVKNKQDAEDVAQETWMKAVKKFHLLYGKSENTIIAYISRISKNESISLLRKKNKEQAIISDVDLYDTLSENDFFASLENHSEELIVKCMKSLDCKYSDVLVYYYLYHYSAEDICDLLDISEDAFRKRISRGREKLASHLRKEGIIS